MNTKEAVHLLQSTPISVVGQKIEGSFVLIPATKVSLATTSRKDPPRWTYNEVIQAEGRLSVEEYYESIIALSIECLADWSFCASIYANADD
jgi:hypothetical protein